jgi:hypothetical protein
MYLSWKVSLLVGSGGGEGGKYNGLEVGLQVNCHPELVSESLRTRSPNFKVPCHPELVSGSLRAGSTTSSSLPTG